MRSTIFRPADTHPSKQTCTHAQSDRGINRFPHTRSLPLFLTSSLLSLSAPGVLSSGLCCLLSAKYQFTILMRPGGPTSSRTHSLGGFLHSKCVRVVCVFKDCRYVLGVMMCLFMCAADFYSLQKH